MAAIRSGAIILWLCLVTTAVCFQTTPSDLRARAHTALLLERPNIINCTENKQKVACPPSKYRSPTGECNNINHRDWGTRGDIFLRIFDSSYGDDFSAPRTSIGSHSLPSADDVVDRLQHAINSSLEHQHITSMLPAWGQLITLDLVQITSSLIDYQCCQSDKTGSASVEQLDQCYVRQGEDCKEYKRTSPSTEYGVCEFKHRNQMNVASGYIDGSGLYGTTEKDFQSIRIYIDGQVDIKACVRCNDRGAVGVLHTVLLKEHNRIAAELAKAFTTWSDTSIFLEARHIVMAQIQHITYNEFLPTLLGQQITSRDSLRLLQGVHSTTYSSSNRAGVFNEVAVAAFPAFLSMLPEEMMGESVSAEILIETPSLRKTFKPIDPEFNDKWTAIALAVQRGRDHGIPAYYKSVNLCEARLGLAEGEKLTYEHFEDLGMDATAIEALKRIYQDPEDVDLLVGALSEKPALGSVFGPTLSCLLVKQFENLRTSDRFWYENDIPPSSLNLKQLQAIRHVTLSGLLCAAGGVTQAQSKAFIRTDPYLNTLLVCNQLSGLDLSPWIPQAIEIIPAQIEVDLEAASEPQTTTEDIDPELVNAAFIRAKESLLARRKLEYDLWLANGGIDARSPDGTAASFSKANRNSLLLANSSLFYEIASNELINSLSNVRRRKRQTFDNQLGDFGNSLQTIEGNFLVTGSISPVTLEPQCEDFTIACDANTPFRTLSGHCNNLRNPQLGQSLTTFARLLPPAYEDGISRPRTTSVAGLPLPNPRSISALIHPDISNLHTRYSLMVMQYAQFLDHDMTMTPIHKGFAESIPSCRPCDSPRTVHPECNPIPIPPRDHFYPEVNVTSGQRTCFPFMRSLPGQQSLGPREQINQNTAFHDSSQIYGENTCICNKLRGFSGRLNSTIHPTRGKELLPQSDNHPECKSPSGLCFIAGDGRASEQLGLTTIHTLFLREHNRIVEGLRGVNPHWTGEQLFNHARRILVSMNQHITFNEFLPRVLSWNAVNLYGLKLLTQGYYKEYNPTCNPSIFTEFAAAAFRFGHSLLRPHIPRLSANLEPIEPPLLLRDGFFKVDIILQAGIIDEISRGLVATPMETLDQFITGEVTNHLFEDRRIPFSGIDLIALNVQRARDHGINGYNHYRALCNLKRAQNWDDLAREIPQEVISRFKTIYSSVDDIDLFPGMMSERPLQGGMVGPTMACIVALQFRQARKCDRFWYENEDQAVRFTPAQLSEIRKSTLAKIVCENLDNPGDMQRAAFDLPSNFLNPRVPCHSIPSIDLSAWRENVVQGCRIGNNQVAVGASAFPSPCTSCVCRNDGPQCASLRINNCQQLARDWPRDAILRDEVCNAQCGSVLQGGNSISRQSRNSGQTFIPGFQG